jgi:hypothetical protein
VIPYLFLEVTRELVRQRAALDDRPEELTVSATNAALGLGISLPFARM